MEAPGRAQGHGLCSCDSEAGPGLCPGSPWWTPGLQSSLWTTNADHNYCLPEEDSKSAFTPPRRPSVLILLGLWGNSTCPNPDVSGPNSHLPKTDSSPCHLHSTYGLHASPRRPHENSRLLRLPHLPFTASSRLSIPSAPARTPARPLASATAGLVPRAALPSLGPRPELGCAPPHGSTVCTAWCQQHPASPPGCQSHSRQSPRPQTSPNTQGRTGPKARLKHAAPFRVPQGLAVGLRMSSWEGNSV